MPKTASIGISKEPPWASRKSIGYWQGFLTGRDARPRVSHYGGAAAQLLVGLTGLGRP